MRLNILNEYEVCINYFNDTRWEKNGYINYRTYANKIGHLINSDNEYEIRKIFYKLVKLNFIEKTDEKRKYLYKYNNPYFARFPPVIILDFN